MTDPVKKLANNEDRIAFLNQKAEEISQNQEEELVTDYDEALQEYKQGSTPHKVKFKGKIFDIPRSMPFSFSLFYMRNCIKKRKGKTVFEIPEDKISEFIEKMFGKDFLDTLNDSDDVELGFVVHRLIPDIMDKWGYNIKQPPASGGEQGKNK